MYARGLHEGAGEEAAVRNDGDRPLLCVTPASFGDSLSIGMANMRRAGRGLSADHNSSRFDRVIADVEDVAHVAYLGVVLSSKFPSSSWTRCTTI